MTLLGQACHAGSATEAGSDGQLRLRCLGAAIRVQQPLARCGRDRIRAPEIDALRVLAGRGDIRGQALRLCRYVRAFTARACLARTATARTASGRGLQAPQNRGAHPGRIDNPLKVMGNFRKDVISACSPAHCSVTILPGPACGPYQPVAAIKEHRQGAAAVDDVLALAWYAGTC